MPEEHNAIKKLTTRGSILIIGGLVALFACAICGGRFHFFLPTPRAIAHIESLGGGVRHDTRWGTTAYECVDLNDTQATDDDLRYVRWLWPSSEVYLRNTQITDEGLKHLYGLPVDEIDLTGTNVTDAGVDNLRRSLPECTIIRER